MVKRNYSPGFSAYPLCGRKFTASHPSQSPTIVTPIKGSPPSVEPASPVAALNLKVMKFYQAGDEIVVDVTNLVYDLSKPIPCAAIFG